MCYSLIILSQFVDFYEIQWEMMSLKAMSAPCLDILYPQLSKMVDVQTSEVDEKFHQATWDCDILYDSGYSKEERL
jgi:hypothetical protein